MATKKSSNPIDQMYALTRGYLINRPERADTRLEFEQACGISRLHQTAYTGIQVQLIDTQQLCQFPIDPGLPAIPKEERALILNIDYAFGEQAKEITRTLCRRILESHKLGVIGPPTSRCASSAMYRTRLWLTMPPYRPVCGPLRASRPVRYYSGDIDRHL